MRRRVHCVLGAAVVLAALMAVGWTSRPDATMPAAAPVEEPQPAAAAAAPRALAAARAEEMAQGAVPIAALLARLQRSSLRGVEPDGELRFDAAGRLRTDSGLRRMFDHFLSLTGEFSEAEIIALLLDHVRRQADGDAAAQVADAFARYLALRHELAAAHLSDDLGERLAQLAAARRRWFGAGADAMFGDEEAEVAHTLARRALLEDAELPASERAAALATLESQRPLPAREAERHATSAVLAEEQTRQFDRLGLDATTRDAERRALWGPEVAQRLAALDAERAAWERRLADYATARDRLLGNPRLDTAARERALAALRASRFDPLERLRIEALDAIGALPGG